MLLKLLLLAILGIAVYRLFGGTLPTIKKSSVRTKPRPDDTQTKQIDGDTLVECAQCGTYVTVKEAIIIGGRYYCDECAASKEKR